ncbi:fimbria/pilus outer membrane usher protein [Mixta sp. Marseille-Q2659]|uniref:fimbria/pilus outer membrane usher protein n=1 Tax=Mixta sp. Marseille-Q2659 TaxID=2736607 RepID=UPI0023B9B54F|nr:fimbria/pilus outer membrane usher protein [Mixta sp. Marseille-Q2659]
MRFYLCEYPMSGIRIFILTILIPASATFASGENVTGAPGISEENDYIFDPALFRGGRISETALMRLSKPGNIAPGNYKVDVYVNGGFVSSDNITFSETEKGQIQPCLKPGQLAVAGIAPRSGLPADAKEKNACLPLSTLIEGSRSHFDASRLRLELSIPQADMNIRPRGYVDPSELEAGSSLGFINYITNYYHVSYSGNNARDLDSGWLSLNGGINIWMWQFRQLSNVQWNRDSGTDWNTLRRYLQRPLPAINSQLSAGELTTTGRLFSGLSYKGISLATDERMLPDSMRGYAPAIRGVAGSTSKVTVSQNGRLIYQTTVAPGPFDINDLYPTSYSGDLDVEVTGADGSVSRFSVPFSAVPESMRPGISRYGLAVGRTIDAGDNSLFGDFTWQYGLSNALSLNTGLRIADDYQSVIAGGVYASSFGALGLDITGSHAGMPEGDDVKGYMAHISYSKTFQPTATTVTLAGYRYSTSGYRELGDVLGVRKAMGGHDRWTSISWQQQSRFDISLNQGFGSYGNIYLSGSTQNYRDGRSRDTQLQAGYSNSFNNGISFNISLSRQHTGGNYEAGHKETVTAVSVSFPLGSSNKNNTQIVSNSWTHASGGREQFQSNTSGMIDKAQTLSYNLGVMRDQQYHQTTINGSLQKRLPNVSIGLNASRGEGYWQASGNAQGGLAIHSGGLTFGPYLSDTFALVEAKGASGASVYNSGQSVIDSHGYALVPSVTPYRYSRVTLDPQGIDGNAELIDSERRVAPVAGAAVRVVFRTRTGHAMLIQARLPDGEPVPLGADVTGPDGTIIGMAGQNGQLYLRTELPEGELIVRWGDDERDRCYLSYRMTQKETTQPLTKLSAVCQQTRNAQ